MKNFIVGLGEILWDIFPEGKVLGGAPANFAYHVSQLGGNAVAASAIGNDPLGDEIVSTLKAKGLESCLAVTDRPTGVVRVSVDPKGIPNYEIVENVAWDNIVLTPQLEKLAQSTIAVCFGSLAQRSALSHQTINKFLDAMPPKSLKIFDINLRQHFYTKEILTASLFRANILKINDEELVVLSDMLALEGDQTSLCLQISDRYGLEIVILTKGTEGSLVLTPTQSSLMPTPIVEVCDTVGAGDSFTAAFVMALIRGKTLEEAHALAVDVSAYVCQKQGGMPSLPEVYRNRLVV